ncbi:MAG: hypothetical protein ACRD5I_03640 [Candidatus Acidiferrales bacterium]
MTRKQLSTPAVLFAVGLLLLPLALLAAEPRVIEILAGADGTFKVVGEDKAEIVARPRETLKLRITAKRGEGGEPDGAVHTFTVPALMDLGWNLRLKQGTKDYTLKAPVERGEYMILCTAQCGKGHDQMRMKLIVR